MPFLRSPNLLGVDGAWTRLLHAWMVRGWVCGRVDASVDACVVYVPRKAKNDQNRWSSKWALIRLFSIAAGIEIEICYINFSFAELAFYRGNLRSKSKSTFSIFARLL